MVKNEGGSRNYWEGSYWGRESYWEKGEGEDNDRKAA